uniref:Ubiquitin-like domain-containing protein n=1 Tax=Neolamprologus brichardi TaxID=32507 RepID=A0A3Q4I4C1_NEOBR
MERNYKVIVYGPRGEKVEVNLCRTAEQFKNITVRQLKERLRERVPEIGEEALLLIFRDKFLDEDDALLSDYGIQHKSVIQALMKLYGGGGPIDENSGMGDKTGKNRSMESLRFSF